MTPKLILEAHLLHMRLVCAMSDPAYVGRHQGEKANQLWRLLLTTGQRWLRRIDAFEKLKEQAARIRDRELEVSRARNAARRQEDEERFKRQVIQPSYAFKFLVFIYGRGADAVWRQSVHVRDESDVDKTRCGRHIKPVWFNEGSDGHLKEPTLDTCRTIDHLWPLCKSCRTLTGITSLPETLLVARNRRPSIFARGAIGAPRGRASQHVSPEEG